MYAEHPEEGLSRAGQGVEKQKPDYPGHGDAQNDREKRQDAQYCRRPAPTLEPVRKQHCHRALDHRHADDEDDRGGNAGDKAGALRRKELGVIGEPGERGGRPGQAGIVGERDEDVGDGRDDAEQDVETEPEPQAHPHVDARGGREQAGVRRPPGMRWLAPRSQPSHPPSLSSRPYLLAFWSPAASLWRAHRRTTAGLARGALRHPTPLASGPCRRPAGGACPPFEGQEAPPFPDSLLLLPGKTTV